MVEFKGRKQDPLTRLMLVKFIPKTTSFLMVDAIRIMELGKKVQSLDLLL